MFRAYPNTEAICRIFIFVFLLILLLLFNALETIEGEIFNSRAVSFMVTEDFVISMDKYFV